MERRANRWAPDRGRIKRALYGKQDGGTQKGSREDRDVEEKTFYLAEGHAVKGEKTDREAGDERRVVSAIEALHRRGYLVEEHTTLNKGEPQRRSRDIREGTGLILS